MKKRNGVYNIDTGRSVTIDKFASNTIEINESEYNMVYSDSMKGCSGRTFPEAWKETGWKPAISIDDGLEGMQNGH
jgi:nucleoside-diphosphate-sugar epimerase